MMLFPLPQRQRVKLKSLGRVKPWLKTNLCVIGTFTFNIWSFYVVVNNLLFSSLHSVLFDDIYSGGIAYAMMVIGLWRLIELMTIHIFDLWI
ncbi:unnamed protein product [Cuscuta campestris]|uniref:Uncharacterized protein n=1 Tax=Cuscuta campestris TaxID=132261 RepID=A0A484MR22_9ASTE|nr:unnamed protein product [Cuscuta campestris]